MSTLHEMAQEIATRLDEKLEFFLVVRTRQNDPVTGHKKSLVATNVGKATINDMVVEGTSAFVMDQVFKKRYEHAQDQARDSGAN